MSLPILTPTQNSSTNILPATGTAGNVAALIPYSVYTSESEFLTGAADQVAYTYRMMGGAVLDIELTEGEVYTAYQDAVLAYSRITNLWQAKNVLGSMLGSPTGSFDHEGQLVSGSTINGSLALAYPKFSIAAVERVSHGIANANAGSIYGNTIFSASIELETGKQDYNLQEIIGQNPEFSASLNGRRALIKRVYHKSGAATWRFFGYYGGLNVVGNLSTYGQYADDSTFEIIPVWQNKLQAMAFEDNLWTRTSHYSYRINGDVLRIWPIPGSFVTPRAIWVEFFIPEDPTTESTNYVSGSASGTINQGVFGVNNVNNLPFQNLPYSSIQSVGKDWIRRYALAVSYGILSQVRGKMLAVPIPGTGKETTLNHAQLQQLSDKMKSALEEELKEILEALHYNELQKKQAESAETAEALWAKAPMFIYRTGGSGLS